MGSCITPYLPADAVRDARSWIAGGLPAFQKAPEHNLIAGGCPNCNGIGIVYVVFAKAGPYQSCPAVGVGTWFPGDGKYGKGWYAVEKTLPYECPACKGKPKSTGIYVKPPPTAKAAAEKLKKLVGG